MDNGRFIRCRNCGAIHHVSPFDHSPVYYFVAGAVQEKQVDDWRAFLIGLTRDVLKPQGAIFIMMPLDKDDEGNLSYSPLVEWARERGAILDKTFSDGAVRHILFDPAAAETFAEAPPTDAVKWDMVLELPTK